ncbi:hypothetical protein FOMG_18823 [Fusarium oxysporum f. sp. melonis 26406]|uniref:Uncharacterized protein n=1 Tax=Fusarium oxysporum f. sp. melonis 26406 TaxID=1089452 RepID=W9Z852_FUSOX|nr:hypothetical protein FOMG_18823 [Fusarium oxysporum f. sp. melonis 26406]
MAHPIEPVTRQRDDKTQLASGSRFWSLMSEEPRSVCVRQLEMYVSHHLGFFPLGSVPTRSMFAFFRDRDPAGRSEPEGMESTAPSTNDVDLLSSATLAVASLEPRICLEENQLTVNDWVVLEHLAKLLGFYEDAVNTLEGDGQQRKRKGGWVGSYGNVWEVIQGFEFLLEVLEDYKQLASEIPDAEHFRININLGWEKLNKYYSRLDETPIYYTALALHPAFRWGYFENEWKDNTKWVMKAKQMVREVWESDYRHLQVVRSPVDDEPVAKRQRKYYNPFSSVL